MKVTDVRAAYSKWRRLPPADAWQAHFWQIAVRVVTDMGVVGHGYGGGGQPAVQVINDHLSRFLVERSISDVVDSAGGGRGVGVDQFPAVVHDRQTGEAHARILPRQPLVRDAAPHLVRGFLCRPRHPRRARRLAPLKALRALQVLQLDHVAVAHAGVALQVRLQADVRITVAQLALGVEHEVLGRAQVGGQKPLNYLFAVDEVANTPTSR